MTQDSTTEITLTPAKANALHRHLSAAIECIESNPGHFKDDDGLFNDVKPTKKVLGRISTALKKRGTAKDVG